MSQVSPVIDINVPSPKDVQRMLACNVHLGARNCGPKMERYIWKRRLDGVHLFNLQKTYEKIVLAARIIAAVDNPKDVCVISARPWGQRASLKLSQYIGAQAIAGRFTPGTFTNQIQPKFTEPRLLIVTDPRTDSQAIREASYANIPVIALCNSDNLTHYIDCVVPANNKGKHSIGMLYWFLTREVLRLRNDIPRDTDRDVMEDLFFYRDPEEIEKETEEASPDMDAGDFNSFATIPGEEVDDQAEWGTAGASEGWSRGLAAPGEEWGAVEGGAPLVDAAGVVPAAGAVQVPVAAVPGTAAPSSTWDSAVMAGGWDEQA